MLLDRLLARNVFWGTLITLAALLGIGFFLTFLSQVHNIGTGDFTAGTALIYAALTMPQTAYDMFPVATVIGAVFALGALAANREIVVLRASGASMVRLVRAVGWAGLTLAALAVVLGEFIAPPAKRLGETIRVQKMYAEINAENPGGVWLKSGGQIVHVVKVESATHLTGISIFRADGAGALSAVSAADGASYSKNGWTLHQIDGTRFSGNHTERLAQTTRAWPNFVLPATFQVLVVDPENLSWTELLRYLHYLRANGLATERYRIAFWHKVAAPVSVLFMVFLALPFAMGTVGGGGAGQRLAVGVVVGLLYYLVDRTVQQASTAFHLPVLLSAWGPTFLLGLAAAVALRTAR